MLGRLPPVLVYVIVFVAWAQISQGCWGMDGAPKRFGLAQTADTCVLPPWLAGVLVAFAAMKASGGR